MAKYLSLSAEVAAAIFGIAVTVAAIVVQLAATRFNHKISLMFIRDPLNVGVLSFMLASTLLCLWVEAAFSDRDLLAQVALSMTTLSLVALLPYFGYVITFISPFSLIDRIKNRAEKAISNNQPHSAAEVIDQLGDIGHHAIDQKEHTIVLACIDAFEDLFHYFASTSTRSESWFTDFRLDEDPDFSAFEPSAIAELEEGRIWFESKILHQYLNMMSETITSMRTVNARLGIAVGRLAGSHTHQPARLDVCIRTLNSFMRVAINAHEARTTYHLMSHYRGLVEQLLKNDNKQEVERTILYIGEYARISLHANQPFIVEVAAYDLAQLGRVAHEVESTMLGRLTDELLTLDDDIDIPPEYPTLAGVRRAHLQHAAYLRHHKLDTEAAKIMAELRSENRARISTIAEGLMTEDRPVYWEFTPRGANFGYLEPEYRPALRAVLDDLST